MATYVEQVIEAMLDAHQEAHKLANVPGGEAAHFAGQAMLHASVARVLLLRQSLERPGVTATVFAELVYAARKMLERHGGGRALPVPCEACTRLRLALEPFADLPDPDEGEAS